MQTENSVVSARLGLAVLALLAGTACGGGNEAPAPIAAASDTPPANANATTDANRAPQMDRVAFEPEAPRAGQRVVARAEASDPDGDAIRYVYSWRLDDEEMRRSEGSFDIPQEAKGARLEVSVIAHDGQLESPPRAMDVDVMNNPPEMVDLLVEPAAGVSVSSEIVASPRAVDADGDVIEFEYTWLVNRKRVEEWSPTLTRKHFERGDSIEVEVRAGDGEHDSEALRSPAILVENSLPVVTSTPSGFDDSGSFRYTPVVEDADGDRRIRFSLARAPEGMQIDWLKGTLSWEPTEEQAGKHEIELVVDDNAGGVVSQNFVLDVEFSDEESTPAAAAP